MSGKGVGELVYESRKGIGIEDKIDGYANRKKGKESHLTLHAASVDLL